MKVKIIKQYKDLGLGRTVNAGEILEVGELRSEVLVNKGFAEIINEPSHTPKAEVKHKPKATKKK